jgi:microcystin degradation protein MlrC
METKDVVPKLNLNLVKKENSSLPSSQRIVPSLIEAYESLMKKSPSSNSSRRMEKKENEESKKQIVEIETKETTPTVEEAKIITETVQKEGNSKENYEILIEKLLQEIHQNREFIKTIDHSNKKTMEDEMVEKQRSIIKEMIEKEIQIESPNQFLKTLFLFFFSIFMMIQISKLN